MDVGKREDALLDKISDLLKHQAHRNGYCVTILHVMRHNAPDNLVPMIDHLIRELGTARLVPPRRATNV